tara:strand:- start:281 stop:1165 length:885 start_codon:yes stop_codon:yes gene_type:complete
MGTLVIVTIVAPELKVAREMVRNAFGQMERLEGILSRHRRDTPLDRLNDQGFIETPPPELVEVMGRALAYSSMTDGAFDVTVAPLLELYASHFEAGNRPPTDREIERALESVDYRRVRVDESAIVLEGSEMKVTLDGIAKGYIVDQTVRTLVDDGAERVLINAGGDMASGGHGSLESPWTVGVRDPSEAQGMLAQLRLGGECIATSGDYMQSFTQDRRFHHIIDPRTGYSPNQASAVTVVTTSAMDADALSTAVMVLGPVAGFQLIEDLDDTEGMIVTKEDRQMRTPGLGRFAH